MAAILVWFRGYGEPTEEPRGNHGELFRAILRFAEHLRENHGGTTENPFGDHTKSDFCVFFFKILYQYVSQSHFI